MNMQSEQQPKGPASLAAILLETLEEEHASLGRMQAQFERQITAVRDHDQEGVEETAIRTSDEVNILTRLKQTRDRQIRLLGRVLRLEGDVISMKELSDALQSSAATADAGVRLSHLREKVRDQALLTQERCRDLEFALQYAVHLGRELLQAAQGIDEPGGGRHYTSRGSTVESTGGQRSLLNRVG